ncbi:MAG: galactokinase [Christensenellales bacterium]
MNYVDLSRQLKTPEAMARLTRLYGQQEGTLVSQIARYGALLKRHEEIFHAQGAVRIFSSPGRTEIIGNHTDHNSGRVLAAAINLDTLAVVTSREDSICRVVSEGYPLIEVDLRDLGPRAEEEGTSAALIRGVAEGMQREGFRLGGFDAAVTSDVLGGSGLSSSAAFEVLVCCVLDGLYNGGGMDPVLRAKISQYAENVHFGKPSGLMDQMAVSVGGMTGIDFKSEEPVIDPLSFSFREAGCALVVVNTGGSHDDLTADYAAIRSEMHEVARFFQEEVLRRVRPEQLRMNMRALRQAVGDRAVLRALHYFDENARVLKALEALRTKDTACFFQQINHSGRSSWELLQNLYASPREQPLALALALAREVLQGKGACRLNGGGFAGTTLNFVPFDQLDAFVKVMHAAFEDRCCHILDVRLEGAAEVFKA